MEKGGTTARMDRQEIADRIRIKGATKSPGIHLTMISSVNIQAGRPAPGDSGGMTPMFAALARTYRAFAPPGSAWKQWTSGGLWSSDTSWLTTATVRNVRPSSETDHSIRRCV